MVQVLTHNRIEDNEANDADQSSPEESPQPTAPRMTNDGFLVPHKPIPRNLPAQSARNTLTPSEPCLPKPQHLHNPYTSDPNSHDQGLSHPVSRSSIAQRRRDVYEVPESEDERPRRPQALLASAPTIRYPKNRKQLHWVSQNNPTIVTPDSAKLSAARQQPHTADKILEELQQRRRARGEESDIGQSPSPRTLKRQRSISEQHERNARSRREPSLELDRIEPLAEQHHQRGHTAKPMTGYEPRSTATSQAVPNHRNRFELYVEDRRSESPGASQNHDQVVPSSSTELRQAQHKRHIRLDKDHRKRPNGSADNGSTCRGKSQHSTPAYTRYTLKRHSPASGTAHHDDVGPASEHSRSLANGQVKTSKARDGATEADILRKYDENLKQHMSSPDAKRRIRDAMRYFANAEPAHEDPFVEKPLRAQLFNQESNRPKPSDEFSWMHNREGLTEDTASSKKRNRKSKSDPRPSKATKSKTGSMTANFKSTERPKAAKTIIDGRRPTAPALNHASFDVFDVNGAETSIPAGRREKQATSKVNSQSQTNGHPQDKSITRDSGSNVTMSNSSPRPPSRSKASNQDSAEASTEGPTYRRMYSTLSPGRDVNAFKRHTTALTPAAASRKTPTTTTAPSKSIGRLQSISSHEKQDLKQGKLPFQRTKGKERAKSPGPDTQLLQSDPIQIDSDDADVVEGTRNTPNKSTKSAGSSSAGGRLKTPSGLKRGPKLLMMDQTYAPQQEHAEASSVAQGTSDAALSRANCKSAVINHKRVAISESHISPEQSKKSRNTSEKDNVPELSRNASSPKNPSELCPVGDKPRRLQNPPATESDHTKRVGTEVNADSQSNEGARSESRAREGSSSDSNASDQSASDSDGEESERENILPRTDIAKSDHHALVAPSVPHTVADRVTVDSPVSIRSNTTQPSNHESAASTSQVPRHTTPASTQTDPPSSQPAKSTNLSCLNPPTHSAPRRAETVSSTTSTSSISSWSSLRSSDDEKTKTAVRNLNEERSKLLREGKGEDDPAIRKVDYDIKMAIECMSQPSLSKLNKEGGKERSRVEQEAPSSSWSLASLLPKALRRSVGVAANTSTRKKSGDWYDVSNSDEDA